MNERTTAEVALLLSAYPELEFREADGWCRVPGYPVSPAVWGRSDVEVAFRFPDLPGQPPYAFWARPRLQLVGGTSPLNYTYPVATPFGDDWGQFSWTPDEWRPAAAVGLGSNMLRWVRSFAARFHEGA